MAAQGVAGGTKWAEVDVVALRDNVRALAMTAGSGCEVMAMVKADGYGHGAVRAAQAALAGGATRLGVSSLPEALELHGTEIGVPVLNVGWSTAADLVVAAAAAIEVTVFDTEAVVAAQLAAVTAGRTIRVHWKLDTGMGRLGTRRTDVPAMARALRAARPHVVVAGLFTHFASADADSTDFAATQLASFHEVIAEVRDTFPDARLHAANSAALLRLPESRLDIVRTGIAMYGYAPVATAVPLRPALALRALVSQVKRLDPGDTVGYGREWAAPRSSLIATVAAGYGDGVDRRNAGRGEVIVGGAICPIVGRVSMDQIGVDITEAGAVRSGEVATLIGEASGHRITAADVAARIGTISYEVLCGIAARVPRVSVDAEGVLG